MNPELRLLIDRYGAQCASGNWRYDNPLPGEELVRPWNIPVATGEYLYQTIIDRAPQRILELGTSTGYSSLWMGAAAQTYGGIIDTVDYYERKVELARAVMHEARLTGTVRIDHARTAPFIERAPDNYYDMVFLDADKNNYHRYLPQLLRCTTDDALLLADNAQNMDFALQNFFAALDQETNLTWEIITVGTGLCCIQKKRQ